VAGLTITLRGVRFAYRRGGFTLEIPELTVPPGLTLLLGPNGAGKSTLLRVIAGIHRPDAGRVTIGDRDLWEAEVEAREPIAYVPDEPDLAPFAAIGETLRLVAGLRREPGGSADRALERGGLATLAHRTGRELSLGQQRRVALAAARIGSPSVLILDDPLEALDDTTRRDVLEWIGEALARNATILLSTHDTSPFERDTRARITLSAGHVVA
jgi:ABC-type multidrug transport system ATPase subunit